MTSEVFVKTYVTAVEIISHFVFTGIGNTLHIHKIDGESVSHYQLLRKQRIHGIRISKDRNQLVCFGNREIIVASVNLADIYVVPLSHFVVGDWIWDVKWKNEEMMVLCAEDTVSLWKWRTKEKLKVAKNRIKCLLYSGTIIGDEWSDSIILAGTMFKSILIWAPSVGTDESCTVLHKLTAHTGAIFSVFYHQKLQRICSTSDDRSARIWRVCMPEDCLLSVESWSRASICLLITVYGHMSRVWKSFIFSSGAFLTTGEDGQLRVWNENGKALHSWTTHQGSSIRSVSVDEMENKIVTGGGDGGICLWSLSKVENASTSEKMERIRFSNTYGLTKLQDIPRRIVLSSSGKLLTITNRGYLLCYDGTLWRCVLHDDRFAGYCLLQISQDRRSISLASIRGDIMILRESEEGLMKVICDENICASKIYSFHWLANNNYVTCCEQGRVELWTLKNDSTSGTFVAQKLRRFILPPCKERWLTSAVETLDGIIVGDRDGSLHLYFHSCPDFHPAQTFKRIHGRLGVSYIGDVDGKGNLFSVGRDGYIRHWRVAENELHLLASNRLPIKWPVQVFQTSSYRLLVAGFNEANFEVWDVEERKMLLTFACGGGHRPWDFFLNDVIRFVFIKKEIVYNLKLSTNRLKVISFSKGFHIREIECMKCLKENVFVSGSEDTTLRLFSIENLHQLQTVAVIRSHVSSIKAISHLTMNNSALVVSVGGRAQMNVCRIHTEPTIIYEELASHMLKSENKSSKTQDFSVLDLEPRHMDVYLHCQNDTVFIYCAGSDAYWRVFTFNMTTNTLQLLREIEYANFCVLKIVRLNWIGEDIVVTFSSDGVATFWDAQSYMIVFQVKLHQSSINSYDYVALDHDQMILATGGDDASIQLSTYQNQLNKIKQMDCVGGTLHEANVTGLKILPNYVISASCDQKIILWRWNRNVNLRLEQLSFIKMYHSLIPDIRGCEIISVKKAQAVMCVYGVGFEVLSVELEKKCDIVSIS